METFETPDSAQQFQPMDNLTQLFTQDLTNVDLSVPLIVPGRVDFIISDMKIVPTKANDGESNLEISLQTKYATKGTKGESFNPGRKLTHIISLKKLDKNGEDRTPRILQDLKRVRIAAGMGDGPFGKPSDYIGHTVSTNVVVESDATGKFADKNVITKWIDPTKGN